jgi:hypothetical protein
MLRNDALLAISETAYCIVQSTVPSRRTAELVRSRISPDHSRGRNPDSNGADDATGATDIPRRADNGGSARSPRRSSRACILGIRGQRKREILRLLWIGLAPKQRLRVLLSILRGKIFS